MNFINPYKLFNVDISVTLKVLKKKYYKFALMCHPDKGGSENDMIMVYNSYLYIKEQLEYRNKYSKMEKINNFKNYFNQFKKKPPPFYEIWIDSDDYKKHILFNKQFEKTHKNKIFKSDGYGEMMDKTNVLDNRYIETNYNFFISQFKFHKNINLKIYYFLFGVKNVFYTDITLYKNNVIDYGNYSQLKNKKINDYTTSMKNINMSDYKLAYSVNNNTETDNELKYTKTIEDLIKERNTFDNLLYKNLQ